MERLHEESVDNLFKAILALESLDECYKFFEDIGTINEIKSFAQRFEVANMLSKGMTYGDISVKTGASTATISRVSKCLNYGDGGYKTAIERIKEN